MNNYHICPARPLSAYSGESPARYGHDKQRISRCRHGAALKPKRTNRVNITRDQIVVRMKQLRTLQITTVTSSIQLHPCRLHGALVVITMYAHDYKPFGFHCLEITPSSLS